MPTNHRCRGAAVAAIEKAGIQIGATAAPLRNHRYQCDHDARLCSSHAMGEHADDLGRQIFTAGRQPYRLVSSSPCLRASALKSLHQGIVVETGFSRYDAPQLAHLAKMIA